jgi:hypothetical protein
VYNAVANDLEQSRDLDITLIELQAFVQKLGRGWEKRYFDYVLLSDNFSEEVLRWLEEPLQHLTPKSRMWFKKAFGGGTPVTRIRKQYLRLNDENEAIASTIMVWLQTAFNAKLTWLKHLEHIDLRDYEDTIVTAGTWLMDAGLLFRLFRGFKRDPSRHRFVYAGGFHTDRYMKFFEEALGTKPIETGGTTGAVRQNEFYITLGDRAREELQKLLM